VGCVLLRPAGVILNLWPELPTQSRDTRADGETVTSASSGQSQHFGHFGD